MTDQQISKLSEIRKQLNQIDRLFNIALVLTFEIEESMIDLEEQIKQNASMPPELDQYIEKQWELMGRTLTWA